MAVVNVTVDNGTGTDYDPPADDVDMGAGSAGPVQFVKLVDGTVGGTQPIVGTSDGSLNVIIRRDGLFQQQTSSGLTTATTAYTAGDQVGALFTFTNMARASGGGGIITGAILHDETDIIGGYDLILFRSSVTLASDNAAFSVSDADANLALPLITLQGAYDIGGNRIAQATNLAVPYVCTGGTSLYAALRCGVGHTFFGATTSLKLDLFYERN